MSFQITRQHLWRTPLTQLLRLARALGVHGCACGAEACRYAIVERVARRIG